MGLARRPAEVMSLRGEDPVLGSLTMASRRGLSQLMATATNLTEASFTNRAVSLLTLAV